MGILDFTPKADNAPTSRRQGQSNDRPQAKLWLNVGYEVAGKFVNLPVGLPIDTMEPAQARGQNEDWIKFQGARNELLKMMQEAGAGMQPGEEREVNLTVKLRRVNEEVSVAQGDNEYSLDPALSKSIFG